MYAVIRRVNFTSIDQLKPRITEDFLPNVVDKLPGFVAYYFIRLSDTELASLSLFETREQAEKSIQVIREWIEENLSEMVTREPEAYAGEVIVTHVAKPQEFPGQMAA